jgi:hypothetical protein
MCWNVGHCLLYVSRLGIAWSSTRIRWGWLPVRFPFRKLINDDRSRGQNTEATLAVRLKDMLNRLELTDARLHGIATDNASSNYSMTCNLQSTLETSGIKWPALRNHIPCMAHVIQLAWGAFISSLSVKGRTKSWEAHEHDQQCGDDESIDIGKSQRLCKEGNTRIN